MSFANFIWSIFEYLDSVLILDLLQHGCSMQSRYKEWFPKSKLFWIEKVRIFHFLYFEKFFTLCKLTMSKYPLSEKNKCFNEKEKNKEKKISFVIYTNEMCLVEFEKRWSNLSKNKKKTKKNGKRFSKRGYAMESVSK